MAVASLSLQNLARHYGKVRAVDDLSVEVPEGAFVTLLGPSGCGKSTTLNLIAGLDKPDHGKILLGDREITSTPPNERRMAMVFQNYALYPNMTVFDNIAFSLKLRHRPSSEVTARVTAVADMLDIGHLLNRKPSQLSGGQQQRVALGPGPGQGAARLPPRRAVQQPRRRPPQPDADRGQAPPPAPRDHHHLRHPRPGRGDDPVRPDRRHARRQDRPGRAAGPRSTASRAIPTSRRSSASPR